jgi:predicted amidophosphoribosyltransferase
MAKHRVRNERRRLFGGRVRDDLFERSFRTCRQCGRDVYVLANDCRDCGASLAIAGQLY